MAHEHGPLPSHVRDTIDLWVSDFLDRPAALEAAGRLGPDATGVLATFLEAACHGVSGPAEVTSAGVAHALLDHLTQVAVPAARRDGIPDLVAAFLGDLEDVGRLADGRLLASQVRASAPTFRDRAAGRAPDLTRPGPKLGRNDPCPCGSGKKYKHCCLR